MATALVTLAWAMVALVLLPVSLLFVPAEFDVAAGTNTGLRLRVRWLFGVVRLAFEPSGQAGPADHEPRDRGRRDGARTIGRLLAIDGLVVRFARLVADLNRSLGWRSARVALRVGLRDPSDTGELCGCIGPALAVWPSSPWFDIRFQPEFAGELFEGEARAEGRFVPARAVAALGRFAVSRPGRRFLRVMLWRTPR